MPHFVVLEHDHPRLHWDLMLEHAGVLKTWRLPEFPLLHDQKVTVEALADHRLLYLHFEGPLSGNRGRVVRRDEGTYEILPCPPILDEGQEVDPMQGERLLLSMAGKLICRIIALERVKGDIWHLWRVSGSERWA